MNDSSGSVIPFVLIVTFIIFYFPQDWLEYECTEYAGQGASQYPSENYVNLYEKGGISILNKFGDTWEMRHQMIEGTKYISYVRPDTDAWTFKLNKEDFVKNVEDKYNIEIDDDSPLEFNIFPRLNISSRLNIEDQQNKIVYENINIDLSQPIFYYPGKLEITVKI